MYICNILFWCRSIVSWLLQTSRILQFYHNNADSEGDQYLDWNADLVIFCFSRVPVDVSPVAKHEGVNTYQKFPFVICILLDLI